MEYKDFFTKNIYKYDEITKPTNQEIYDEIFKGLGERLNSYLKNSNDDFLTFFTSKELAQIFNPPITYLSRVYRSFRINGVQRDLKLNAFLDEYLKRFKEIYKKNNCNIPTEIKEFYVIIKSLINELKQLLHDRKVEIDAGILKEDEGLGPQN